LVSETLFLTTTVWLLKTHPATADWLPQTPPSLLPSSLVPKLIVPPTLVCHWNFLKSFAFYP
jgi:hypothetical protein